MTVEKKKRGLGRKILKGLGYGCVGVMAILLAAHLIWKYSGSNEWKLDTDKNGIKIYSIKVPGSTFKQFRAVTRVKSTMSRSMGPMLLTDLATCADWVPGCTGMTIIEPWNPRELRAEWLWSIDYGFPFAAREFLLKTQVTPDPKTKTVRVDNVAFPDDLPRNKCCFRVSDMHNTWRYTPVGNGEIEVELVESLDIGVPYPLFNSQAEEGLYDLFSRLPILLNDEKYSNAKFEFLDAMAANDQLSLNISKVDDKSR